jgi:uncharacterized repeat protein (TIGR01451 family)
VVNHATVGFVGETLQSPGEVDSPDVVNPVAVPDLMITKTPGGAFVAGRTVPFTLAVRNVGDAPTFGPVTVTDPLADDLTLVTPPAGAGWDCGAGTARAVHCTRADALAPGDSYPEITFTVRVAGSAPAGTLRNTATVSTPGDGNPTNDSDSAEGPLTRPMIDLALRKFALTPRAFPGGPVAFLLFVRNLGPDTATRVVVSDTLPPGLTAVALHPSRGSCAGTTCHLGRMPAGAGAVIVVRAVAGTDTGGRRLRDDAVVQGRQDEVTLDNNRDTASVRIVPLVDLSVTKTAAESTVPAGRPVSFVVTVTNHGPSTATHVTLTDALPAPLQLISATPLQGTCTGLTCDLGTLAAGASTQVVVEASSDASVAGATLTNTATVRARQPELDLADNRAGADVTFTAVLPGPAPDVGVTKTSDTGAVDVGGEVRYRITATNRGAGAASSVLVTDTPDPELLILSVTPSQGSCSAGTPITCALGALAPGAHATVDVVARALAPGRLRNGVTVVPGQGGSGDGDVEGIIASRAPHLTLRKRATPRAVHPGDVVTYALTVRAHGTGTARLITVCDRLPRGVTIESYGSARPRQGRLCWTIRGLRAGRTRTLRLRVTVDPGTRGVLTNRATLTLGTRAPRVARARVRVLGPLACPARVAPVATIAC